MHDEEFLRTTLKAKDLLYNMARRLVRDEHEAEDLVQETYLRAYVAWVKQQRPDRVEPWLATICLNLARSEMRRRARRPVEVLHENAGLEAPCSTDVEAETMAQMRAESIRRALWKLRREQRVALVLMDICGLTAGETATVMGSPRGTVLSWVHRGRKALAALLEHEAGLHDP